MSLTIRLFFLAVLAFGLVQPGFGQVASAESGFRSRVIELHTNAIVILGRLDGPVPRGSQETQMRDEIFALIRLAHRLEEEAVSTNVQAMRRGEAPNRTLSMAQQAAKAIDGMLTAIDNYLTYTDRSFLDFARDNSTLVWSIRKVM